MGSMAATPTLAPPSGLERLGGLTSLSRHRHPEGFVAVVLGGGYLESGDAGRFNVVEGDVLIHAAFEAHRDEVSSAGAEILNLPCPKALQEMHYCRVAEPTALAKLAERDSCEAQLMLAETAILCVPRLSDWMDLLAAQLRTLEPFSLANWAKAHDLAPETISRGFSRAYGISPHLYRAEARARRAIADVRNSARSLAAVAAKLGFSDQAHMTRAVRALSGRTPGQWRSRAADTR